ncbi:MAG TPA: DUF3566 domain-containing protein, partial [Stackebrandtia sp.]|nr:DUF3566 domain-containing protein [Stackebrandtia sp.]
MTDAQAGGASTARAAVAGDNPATTTPTQGGTTSYTRPPGMTAPPTSPDAINTGATQGPARVADAVRAARA